MLKRLETLLSEVGVKSLSRPDERAIGFAVPVSTDHGDIFLDLPTPAYFSDLDPNEIGFVTVDATGRPRSCWGLASKIPWFRPGSNLASSPLAELLDGGALYLDGVRYFASGDATATRERVILAVSAYEEKKARRQASKGWRVANTLKRLGKALTLTQSVRTVCVAAAHEIASATDLAAALIWVLDDQGCSLDLFASVGVNRKGCATLSKLSLRGGRSCLAEMVADSGRSLVLSDVAEHALTESLESSFTYLKPKALFVAPLKIAERTVGVVELLGKEGDLTFEENSDLFETVAEHLALALNSAWHYERAERGALVDSLTGIPNHRSLQQFLHAGLSTAARKGEPFSAVMIDVDHFRAFNEEEGHDAGDRVLVEVAQALRSCVRPGDLAARYGGEEFTLLLPSTSIEVAMRVAERARLAVEGIEFVTPGGAGRPITISLGCATYPSAAGDSVALLKSADSALYEAKRLGRNQVAAFEGASEDGDSKVAIDLDVVAGRLRESDRDAGLALLDQVELNLKHLATALGLTDVQTGLLRGLLLVLPAYLAAWDAKDPLAIEALERAPEFRLIASSLLAFHERFDGLGPRNLNGDRIPMIARVAQVLYHVGSDKLGEAGRFDPAIVAVLNGFADAA